MMLVPMIVALALAAPQMQRTPPPRTAPTPPPTAGAPRTPSTPTAPPTPGTPPQPSQVTIPLCPAPSGGMSASTGNEAGSSSGQPCSNALAGMGGPTVPH